MFILEDKHPQCMFITAMLPPILSFSLTCVFLSISFFIPLCVHWGVTNWWFSGLKEAQMEKQMERVIGHVYAFYLRFLPPFFFPSSLSHSLFCFPSPRSASKMNFYFVKSSHTHISSDTFARLTFFFLLSRFLYWSSLLSGKEKKDEMLGTTKSSS